MYKDGQFNIQGYANGMAQSPYTGFASIVGCEVFDPLGICKIANRTVLNFTSVDLPVGEITDPNGTKYTVTKSGVYRDGVLFRSLGDCRDIVYFQNYILVRLGTSVSAYGPLNLGPGWTDSMITGLDSKYYGKMLSGTVEDVNGAIYLGNGQYVATLKQVAGQTFTPSNGSTFSYNATAYTINNGYCVTLAEIGDLLAIGVQGGASWVDRVNHNIADIHYWDRSATKADSIVHLKENSIQALIGKDNRIFAVAGTRGNIYETDTTNYTLIRQLPWNNNRPFSTSVVVYPNAIAFNSKGNLLVGTSTGTDSFGVSNSKQGVYEVSFTKGYPTVLKNIISTGNVGSTQNMAIGVIRQAAPDVLSIGWQDGSAYGMDTIDYNAYVATAYLETPITYIAPRLPRHAFQNIEFKLGKPLVAGQSISVYGRRNLSETYKLLKTFDFATYGAVISGRDKCSFIDVELFQSKVTLSQPTSTVFPNNIELINVAIW